MKRFLLAFLILLALPSLTTAQTNTTADVDTLAQSQCTAVLNINMRYRMRDSQTNNEVSALQDFLNVEGYLASQPTGFFGLATLTAVKKFQSASGFVATGYVGPLTRAKINEMSCGAGVTVTPTQYTGVTTPQVATPSAQSSLPAGCASTVGFSATTGNRCNTPATVTLAPSVRIFPAGCTSTIGYSSTTGQKCSAVTAVVQPVTTTDIATADLKVNGSDGPLTLSLNQQVFLSWKTTGMRSCVLRNVNETPSNGTDTSISPIQLSGSMYAYYTGYNPAIMLSCFKTTDGSISSGGDIVKLTYAPVPVVATSTQNTTAYAITSISEIYPSYAANAQISPSIKTVGGEGDGTPATSDKGYNIQAYVFNASDTDFSNYLTPSPAYSYNGTYNASTGYWNVQMNAPSSPGSYNLRVVLYCSRLGTTCYNAGGHGTESVKIIPFTVQGMTVTAVPMVEFIGTPTLSIQYEKGSGNELIEGRATVKVTAGNSPITIYQNSVSGTLPFNNSSGTTYSNGMKFSTTASNGTVVIGNIGIPANTSQTFTIVNTAPTKELFAGTYLVKPAGFQYIDSSNSYQTVQYTSFISARSSNTLTIVGETSPYITSASSFTNSNGYGITTITGVRFNQASNIVDISGMKFDFQSVNNGTTIQFIPSAYGIAPGNHIIQVTHPTTGASNRLNVNILGSSVATTASPVPTVEFTTTPKLGLQYDAAGKESALVGNIAYKITAGSADVMFSTDVNYPGRPFVMSFDGGGGWNIDGPSLIPAGTTATYVGTLTALTKQMFAGSYKIFPSVLGYSTNGTWQNLPSSSFINAQSSSPVTIIGETSPYITSVTNDATANVNITITGVRFHSTTNTVNIGGVEKVLPSLGGGLYINTSMKDFGLTAGDYYIQVTHPTEGASNRAYKQILNSPTVTPPLSLTPAIKLLSPNGGETLTQNSQYTVQWNTSNYVAGTLINLYLFTSTVTPPTEASYNAGVVSTLVGSTPNDGSEVVTIPSGLAGATYFIRVLGRDMTPTGTAFPSSGCLAGCKIDDSDAPFTITAPSTQSASVIGAFAPAPVAIPASTLEYEWIRNLEVNSPYADDVSALQTALKKEGVYTGDITGGFYAQTYTAVKEFQSKYGIESTGFVGPTTRAKLNELY